MQSSGSVRLFMIQWAAAHQASLSLTISCSLLKFMTIASLMPFNHLTPLFLLPSILPSIRVLFQWVAVHTMWPKQWSFSLSICPSNEHSGLISCKIDWFHLLAVPGTLKSSTPQFESTSSSMLCLLYCPALTTVCDYWKDHSLDYMDLCWQSDVFLFFYVFAF